IEKLGVRNAMIFQEPIASLNPLLTVGRQIEEAYRTHAKSEGRKVDAAEARKVALAAMERVRITDVERRHGQFPFELSGGMCQRIMIASALVTDPDLLIADEPTTALDATIQLQVLNLIRELRSSLSMSVIIVTHDLGVVADVADRVVVMYAGAVVETGSVDEIFARPRHPYTRKLLDVVTAMDVGRPKATLPTIEGTVLSPFQDIGGCRFQPRCDRAIETCLTQVLPLVPTDGASGHSCACWATNAPAKAKVPA
ncbi:MAG: ABC transporter ATP-binding protein, partial [Geminicoccaceae bacterium]